MPWDVNQINSAFMEQSLGGGMGQAFDQGRIQAKEERIFDQDRAMALEDRDRKIAEAQRQLREAMERKAQKAADQQLLATKPTREAYQAYFLRYPEEREAAQQAYGSYSTQQQQDVLSNLHNTRGYLMGGKVQEAADSLRARIAAEKKAGTDTADEEQMLQQLMTDPNSALATVNGLIAAISDPAKTPEGTAKLEESGRAAEVQPAKVRQEVATAGKLETEAQYAPQVIETDLATKVAQQERWAAQTANEVADMAIKRDSLELDRDKLQSTIQLELDKLDRQGTQLDAGARAEVNKTVGEAASSLALADRAKNLADRFAASSARGAGWRSDFAEWAKGAYGNQDPVSGLRAEYQRIVNQQAVKNLPPGPASDKDIELAKQGFPPPTAGKDYVVSFLRGMEKMQRAAAQSLDRRANWISTNGSLSTSRRDMDVGGVLVPAGTTYTEFERNAGKVGRRGETPAGVQSIINKYGGR